jgi:hypothetical protein
MNYFTKPYLSAICFLLLSLMLAFQAEVTANTADELRNTLFGPNTTSVTVTCQVTLNSGESPEGTFITLTGVNNPALYFEGVAPESGTVVFTGVTEANYRLNAVLEGYYELDTLITILSNRLIPVNLQEITITPLILQWILFRCEHTGNLCPFKTDTGFWGSRTLNRWAIKAWPLVR